MSMSLYSFVLLQLSTVKLSLRVVFYQLWVVIYQLKFYKLHCYDLMHISRRILTVHRIIRIRVAQDCESWGLCTHGYAWLWTQRGIRLLDDSFPIAVTLSTPLHSVNS